MWGYFLILFATLLTFPAAGRAEEGLFLGPPPSNLAEAWNSTVVLDIDGGGVASGAIIGTAAMYGKYYVFILTAGHLELSTNWPDRRVVTPSSQRKSIRAYPNYRLRMTHEKDGWWADSPLETNSFSQPLRFVWGKLDWTNLDAGLLVFETPKPLAGIHPLSFASSPDALASGTESFVIGAPMVTNRAASVQRVPLQSPGLITKRWSRGRLTGPEDRDNGIYGTSADCQEGMSGGPVLNARGEILGVVNSGNFDGRTNGYLGSDDHLHWATAFYPFTVIRPFIAAQLKAFSLSLRP